LWRLSLIAIAALWAGTAFWQAMKPMPPGTRIATAWYAAPAAQVGFLADVSAADAYGRPVVSQAIFDQMLAIVRAAREFIILDYFLFNDEPASAPEAAAPIRALSKELRDALIERRRVAPELRVLFVTDPINTAGGGVPSNDFQMLRAAGVQIVVTDRRRLRDASFLCANLWRLTVGRRPGHGRLESANHRRTLIADDGRGGLVGMVGSADPRDASSAYSNVAAKLSGPVLAPLLASELAIARFSGWRGVLGPAASIAPQESATPDARATRVSIATEGAIHASLLEHLNTAAHGDAIDIAMFHIADRAVIEALLAANARGAHVRLILDPNKTALGESSIPNGPVASELVTASDGAIHVRWYRTHGEEFHTKLVMIRGPARLWATLGSADLTRRNLADYDLNANVAIETPRGTPLARQMGEYFETLWGNRALLGVEYSADFGVYADPSQARYWLYRLMDWTGIANF
jgi:phosphatidylserine/phosphatidylglycerophosphate/cardiolipin synthase-like enzyme